MRKMFSRKLLVIATSGIMLGILAVSVFVNQTAQPVVASSHREAPLITADPLADNTDVYAFRSTEAGRDGFVTLIANWIPFQEPSGGPHFYKFDDTVLYEIKIDNTGDGLEDITYQFRFTTQILNPGVILGMAAGNENGPITSLTDPDYNEPQTYTVRRIDRLSGRQGRLIAAGLRTPPNNIGERTTPNYEQALGLPAVYNLPGGGKVFAGQRDEGFYIDVGGVFDTFNLRSIGSTGGVDSLAGFNVNTVALEVPIQELTRTRTVPASSTVPEAVIGVWATASRRTTTVINPDGTRSIEGPFRQISRLGNPLVNELVIPTGLKDAFNSLSPTGDAIAAPFVVDPQLAKYLQVVFGITIPPAPRNDLVQIFATGIPVNAVTGPTYTTFLSDGTPHEFIRLNVAIAPSANPNRLGLLGLDFAGYPNGRRVGDDVVDIALRAVAGGTPFTPATNVAPNNTLGDGVDRNDVPYLTRFPYLGTPHSGNTTTGVPHEHHVLR